MLDLRQQVEEAERLLSQREGVHEMRSALGAVRSCAAFAESGDYDDALLLEYAEAVLAKMRIAVATGVYPGRETEAGKRLRAACDAVFPQTK